MKRFALSLLLASMTFVAIAPATFANSNPPPRPAEETGDTPPPPRPPAPEDGDGDNPPPPRPPAPEDGDNPPPPRPPAPDA